MPEKAGVKVSMNTAADVIQRHCGWLTCMEITIFIAEVTIVYQLWDVLVRL